MSKLDKFLKESTLSADAKALIQEAWNEEKQNIAAQIRQELKERFEKDKLAIVEGLNELTNSVIQEELQQFHSEKRKLVEDRAVIRKNLKAFEAFSNSVLKEEVQQLHNDRLAIGESLKAFSKLSNQVIKEELQEFHGERQALIETRVKLVAEGRRKINEAQKAWVKKTSECAAKFIQESTQEEFNQLRTQLQEAKKNMFGRKIFEAFANEYMTTQFNENAQLKKIQYKLNESSAEIMDLRNRLVESNTSIKEKERSIKIMEDKHNRAKILSSLTKPLNANQKSVMEGLLEKTPTEKLTEDFNKYLKPVLNESSIKKPQKKINESKKPVSSTVTGNRQPLSENVSFEDDTFTKELENIAKFAGIRK